MREIRKSGSVRGGRRKPPVYSTTYKYGTGDGTVTEDSLIPQFFKGKDCFGNEITEIVPCVQDSKRYSHDGLPSSPLVIEKVLDYLLGEDYVNPVRTRTSGIESAEAAEAAVEKEMLILWNSTADLTIVDPEGRTTRIRTGSGEIENTIPGFFCLFLTDQSALFLLGDVVDGSYEFQISGSPGTSYEIHVKHSVNSFDAGEQSFSGVVPEGGQTVTAITPVNNHPMPLFTISSNPAFCNQPITFDASNSYHLSSGHTITEYAWDWTSDGIYDDFGVNVSHTFSEDGSYIVTLKVTDDNVPPKSMTFKMALSVSKEFEADFKAMSTLGRAPFTAEFQDLSAGAQTWSWDFNNDGVEDSREQNPSYKYDLPGTYTVRLTVTRDSQTDTRVIEDYIKVTEEPIDSGCPTVKANGPYSGSVGVAVLFSSLGCTDPDGDSLRYFWDFGDGALSTEANPSHIYTREGTYTGTLSVDDGTCIVDESFQVEVEAPVLIKLDQFIAASQSNQITLTWNTLSEIENAGFNLWRSESENETYTKVNSKIIEAEGGATQKAEYAYSDDTANPGVRYYYKLEDIDTRGISTFHGPVSAMISKDKPAPDYYPPYLPYIFSKPAWPHVYGLGYSWWPYYPYP